MASEAPAVDDDCVRCAQCGFPHERAAALLADAQNTIDGLTSVLGQQNAKITRLEAQAARDLNGDKRAAGAREVLTYWAEKLAPKAREVHSVDRMTCVIARLNGGFTVEEMKLCVDGYAKRPYVTAKGRRSSGTPQERRIEATLIFRDPGRVEAGIALVKAPDTADAPLDVSTVDWRKAIYANHHEIIRALTQFSGKPYYDQFSKSSHTECPRCGGRLEIFEPDRAMKYAGSLLRCYGGLDQGHHGCGLDETMFFKAMQDDASDVKMLTRSGTAALGG